MNIEKDDTKKPSSAKRKNTVLVGSVFLALEIVFLLSNVSLAARSPVDNPLTLVMLLGVLVIGYWRINLDNHSRLKLALMTVSLLAAFALVFAANKLLIVAL